MRILDFFHACANQRFRSNKIQILEHNGSELTNHDQKAHVLHAFYHSLLGCSYPTIWNFQLSDIYPENTTPLTCLDTPFCASEISLAFRHMHSNASPGPDGFGPSFFKATWNIISPYIYALFDSFYNHSADLERINRS